MLPFLARRILLGLFTLVVVVSLTFLLMRMMPGNPFSADRKLPPQIEANLREKYGRGGTVAQQYVRYVRGVARGDLGPSTKYKARTVNEIIAQTLPVSIQLGSLAFVIALGAGVTLGSLAATGRNTWVDQASMFVALACISLPVFMIAPLCVLVFGLKWALFPVAGWGTPQHLVLPAICLALPFAAFVARLMRNSMLDVLNQDFIRTARAKGLGEAMIVVRHALKVALLPVLSFSGPLAANLLTGSLVIEEIFKIPGIGPFFVNSVLSRDDFLTCGVVIVYSSLLIAFNILVDALYTLLDRRIRLS